MDLPTSEIIALFFAFVLLVLVIALIFRKDFRDAVLGGPGEASIAGIITVKGVAIVLLCGILIGGILFALSKGETAGQPASFQGPVPVRLNVHFEPNEVNPRHPEFKIQAFIKTTKGPKPVDCVHLLKEGALSVEMTVPDMDTPFFIAFETPRGTWVTDDFSVHETVATARRQMDFQ